MAPKPKPGMKPAPKPSPFKQNIGTAMMKGPMRNSRGGMNRKMAK